MVWQGVPIFWLFQVHVHMYKPAVLYLVSKFNQMKVDDQLLESLAILYCYHLLEFSGRDDSNKWSQHKDWLRNKKTSIWKALKIIEYL